MANKPSMKTRLRSLLPTALLVVSFTSTPCRFAWGLNLGSAGTATNRSLGLKEAVEFAIGHSPAFDSLKRQLNIADLQERTATARLLPSLDLSATQGIQDSSPRTVTNSPWASQLNLGLVETLYDNGVTWTNRKIAKLMREQAQYNFEDQKNQISLDVVTQFLAYSLDVKLLQIQEKQFKLVSRQYEMISKDYYQGIKTKNDYLRFKTQVSRSEIDLVTARGTVEKAKIELRRIIGTGREPGEGASESSLQPSTPTLDFVPIPLEALKSEEVDSNVSLEDHFRFRSSQVQKEINRLTSDLTERKLWPEWTLASGLSYGSSNYLGTGQTLSDNAVVGWNALLTVTYNIFDWGIRSRDREVAIQTKVIQGNQLDIEMLALGSQLSQLQINVRQVQKNYGLAKELLSLEQSNIQFIEREYRNGKVQYLDLINGLNNLSDAEIKFSSAVSDLQVARYTFLYHQGKLYDAILK